MTDVYRLSGAGNDFLALAEPAVEPTAEQMRAWCRRGVSLGADGVFLLRRQAAPRAAPEAAPQGERDAVVGMDYFNADGGPADLCVNGTRCAAQLAFHLGWAADRVRVATPAGVLAARRISDSEVELEAPLPQGAPRPVEIDAGGSRLTGWSLAVGVPHAVMPWHEDLARCPVDTLGPPVRHDRAFPQGANANFVRYTGPHEIEVRTYERGVEAETLACGTGVLAAVAVGVATLQLALPVRARTRGGFVLTIDGETVEGMVRRWSLAGDARLLSRGELFAGAEAELPAAPEWSATP